MNEITEEPNENTLIIYENDRIKNINNFNFYMKENIK